MQNTVRGPTLQAFRRPATVAVAVRHARYSNSDAKLRRRSEPGARIAPARGHIEGGRGRFEPGRRAAQRAGVLGSMLERHLFQISAALFVVGAVGWCWLIYGEFRSSVLVAPAAAYAVTTVVDPGVGVAKSDSIGTSTYVRFDHMRDPGTTGRNLAGAGDPTPSAPAAAKRPRVEAAQTAASIVAREWKIFESTRVADRGHTPAKQSAKETNMKPPVRLAALESDAPQIAVFHSATESVPSRVPFNIGAKTSLVDFETAPFPYHGRVPGSNRPFLNAGEPGHRGHVNFRGRIFWESETFGDRRVLLHVPPGFDPKRPAVMVVYFHGHGANLARDVRDRQQVPAQITAAGLNAVLVAPQFAVNAADSSAGKFWEPNGFKRFLDEAAVKLASLYGDPRSAAAFANMPLVIVAYSGGFGPTLSVLDRGGVRSRVRGVVLLDALYAGIDRFADWIADNRSTFFVSSYTPHTAHHNADLEHLLSERSVPYGSELRRDHFQGMVSFLPAGDVSHRDFVTHAWADNPIKDVLARMNDVGPRIETAATSASISSSAFTAARN